MSSTWTKCIHDLYIHSNSLVSIEEFRCKNRQLNFFVFEKNEIKVLNLLGNALENVHIFAHKIKVVC
jgi:hypothetical protein